MPLIDLKSNLKNLKFGNDRIDGGNSNQPYIQTPIPDQVEDRALNYDFILRGGASAVQDSLIDVKRLGKYFIDLKSPSGLLFVAKQNLLSRTAVRTQASGILNEGIYTPLSTLIEAGGVAFGLHVNKQGLNPFDGIGGINTYVDAIKPSVNSNYEVWDRLTVLLDLKSSTPKVPLYTSNGIIIDTGNVNILSYGGGPGSTLGIGKTNIKFADQRTGENNINGKEIVKGTYLTDRASQTINRFSLTTPPLGVANKWFEATKLTDVVSNPNLSTDNGYTYVSVDDGLKPVDKLYGDIKLGQWAEIPIIDISTTLPPGALPPENDDDLPKNGFFEDSNRTITYTQTQLLTIPTNVVSNGESVLISNGNTSKVGDFRALIRKETNNFTIARAPNYTELNIEERVNLGNPGAGLKSKSYTSGYNGSGSTSPTSFDIINASTLYQSQTLQGTHNPDSDAYNNDLVKFRIGVIDNEDPTKKTFIHFRAFLDQISDSYNADWQPTKYIGRGENFYTYGGFDRKVSLSWTVAAQSKIELIPMYKKLNYLASVCAPDYSKNGYMRGNLVTLTVGGYFYEQPGIITSLSYEMNEDNDTWEIGINDTDGGNDSSVKELPHIIRVKGFNFIPIHDFVPRLQQNKFNGPKNSVSEYGDERYIALSAGYTTNYDK
jgi:hypothetical protein